MKVNKKYGLFSGLSRTFLLWFVSLSIIPILIIGGIIYNITKTGLTKSAKTHLKEISQNRSLRLKEFIEKQILDLNLLSNNIKNQHLIKETKNNYLESGKNWNKYIGSYKNKILLNKTKKALDFFKNNYNYYDLFLVDLNGNILYTVEKEDDLSKNLLQDEYLKTTEISKIYQESLKNGNPIVRISEKR